MITAKHPSKDSINKTLTNLNDRWTSLAQASSDKDVRLRQAAQQVFFQFYLFFYIYLINLNNLYFDIIYK